MKDDASLREFMSKLDVGAYIWDGDRKISFWNKAAERLSGYSAEEMLGGRCSDNRLRHVTARRRQPLLERLPHGGDHVRREDAGD